MRCFWTPLPQPNQLRENFNLFEIKLRFQRSDECQRTEPKWNKELVLFPHSVMEGIVGVVGVIGHIYYTIINNKSIEFCIVLWWVHLETQGRVKYTLDPYLKISANKTYILEI